MRNTPSGTWATLVKRMRAATGMTGADLARRLDVDRATIWRWEAGRQKPESADIVKAFADIFGLDVDDALASAGLRPAETEPAPREPMDPDVLAFMRMLADPETPEATKAQIRTMMRALLDLAESQPKPPRRRKATG
jgi:transcriptional regulator with XRE-family HTH domain